MFSAIRRALKTGTPRVNSEQPLGVMAGVVSSLLLKQLPIRGLDTSSENWLTMGAVGYCFGMTNAAITLSGRKVADKDYFEMLKSVFNELPGTHVMTAVMRGITAFDDKSFAVGRDVGHADFQRWKDTGGREMPGSWRLCFPVHAP